MKAETFPFLYNLLICLPILGSIFYIYKKEKRHKYAIVGFLYGIIVVPLFFIIIQSLNIITFFIYYSFLIYILSKRFPLYKALIYPIAIYIIILFYYYIHFIIITIFFNNINVINFYILSSIIYSLLYLIVGLLIDKKINMKRNTG